MCETTVPCKYKAYLTALIVTEVHSGLLIALYEHGISSGYWESLPGFIAIMIAG